MNLWHALAANSGLRRSERRNVVLGFLFSIAAISSAHADEVKTKAADGVTVYGETYFGELGEDAPIIALFHQAGGDGRGEYGPLTDWLNEIGFRVIAWDQRAGGDRFGGVNRTVEGFGENAGYCAGYPDLEAGLGYTLKAAKGAPLAVWGSSYSAALVFRLAHDHAEKIDAVVAASPASGDPMEGCRLETVLDEIFLPVLALRPRREIEFTQSQADLLIEAGVTFHIVENGVHGSSMLVDERTEHDMSDDREFVAGWLHDHLSTEE